MCAATACSPISVTQESANAHVPACFIPTYVSARLASPLGSKMVAAGPYLANHAISSASRINPTMRLTAWRGCHVMPALARAPRRERDRPKLRRGMALTCFTETMNGRASASRRACLHKQLEFEQSGLTRSCVRLTYTALHCVSRRAIVEGL